MTAPDPLSAAVEAYRQSLVNAPALHPSMCRDALQSAIDAYIEASGCVMAPKEPTESMQAALTELGRTLIPDNHFQHERDQYTWFALRAYRAMLAAAPPPTEGEG